MSKIYIKEILDILATNNINYKFKGNQNAFVSGYSSLKNYKYGTMTFLSSLNKFTEIDKVYIQEKYTLVLMHNSEPGNNIFENIIQVEKPKYTFFKILEIFEDKMAESKTQINNYKFNYIDETAVIGKGTTVGKNCVIEDDVIIGDNCFISHNVVIKSKTKIGSNVTILSGVVIGEMGFNPLKSSGYERYMVNHYGGVEIGNDVFIGSNTTISKGTLDDTILFDGVKINKSAVIAHNVSIGENTVITSPVFIGGSVVIERNCHIAANVIRNQLRIEEKSTLGLGSVIVKNVEKGSTIVGNPGKLLRGRRI